MFHDPRRERPLILTPAEWDAILLTTKLAATVTILLLIIGTPLAWWLSRSRSLLTLPLSALVSLPFVLPPSVLGFYLLIALSPEGPIGKITSAWKPLAFSFEGLVVASLFHSLPFMVQPLQTAFSSLGNRPLEIAATLGCSPLKSFFCVVLPLCQKGFLTSTIMTFAHTIGEFGVVLMIGGNIPKETRVVSIFIYDLVESLNYERAHRLSLIMLVFSFCVMLFLHVLQTKSRRERATL